MYNRYIPGNNGTYERRMVPEQISRQQQPREPENCKAEPPCVQERNDRPCSTRSLLPQGIDIGDLLLLCIVLLLMLDSEEEDILPLLATVVIFLFC